MKTSLLLFVGLISSGISFCQQTGSLKVGDAAYGGIIFYLDKSGVHGLLCSKRDLGTGIMFNDEVTIRGEQGGKLRVNKAQYLCSEYSISENGKVYDDWFMPSKDQLFLIYQHKDIIEKSFRLNGGKPFRMNTELNPLDFCNSPSWDQEFNYCYTEYEYRKMKFNVRAIREF